MSLRNTVKDALNIRSGEGLPIALLAGYSFLAGICLAYVISLGNAFFLVEFGPGYLAPGYIVTGIVGYLTGLLLSLVQRRLSFVKLLHLVIIFLFALTCTFRVGFWFAPDRPLVFGLTTGQLMAGGMFVGIGTYIMLVYFVFRSLASRLFNLRQGKRLFGLISSGDVISSMIGFFSVPLLIRVFPNAADLLFIASGSLLLCLWVINLTTRRFSSELASPPGSKKVQPKSGFSDLIKSRYFILFFLLSAASVFGFYYIDYAFLGQLRVRFPDKAQLAQFIGIFYGVIRIVEFFLKTFLSGWLISQYGLRFGLIVLPLLLCVTSGLAALSGTLLANATSVVFLLMALAKLIERVVTKSLYDPSFNVLYQSLDSDMRLSVQTKIEGIVQQLAVVLAGLTLLFFSWAGSFQLVINILVLIFAGWILVSVFMYRAYRNTLLQTLSQQSKKSSSSASAEISSLHVLNEQLDSDNPDQVICALNMLEQSAPALIDDALKKLLHHPDPQIRQHALQTTARQGSLALLETVEQYFKTETDPSVQESAQQALDALGQIRTVLKSPHLSTQAQSIHPSDRLTAARALSDPHSDSALLSKLMEDPHPGVRRMALVSAGKTGQTGHWLQMVSHLSQPAFGNAAASALIATGSRVLPILQAAFSEPRQSHQTRTKIARIHGLIGGDQAATWLADRLSFWDTEVRQQILSALELCDYRAQNGQTAQIKEEIKEAIDNATWCMSALLDLNADDPRIGRLKSVLGSEIDQNRERVFRLLSLIYDAQHIRLVQDNFKSGSNDGKAYALELIDLFVDQDLKVLLFPLLDDLTLAQRLKRLEPYCPQQHLSLEARLKDIVNRQPAKTDCWTKICALHAFPVATPSTVADELMATLFHPDPLLRETAAGSIYEIDRRFLGTYLQRFPQNSRPDLGSAFQQAQDHPTEGAHLLLAAEKVTFLKRVPFFASIPESILVRWASALKERRVDPGETFAPEDNAIYIIAEGQVRTQTDEVMAETWGESDVLGDLSAQKHIRSIQSATAIDATRLWILDCDLVYDLIADDVKVAQGMLQAVSTSTWHADADQIQTL